MKKQYDMITKNHSIKRDNGYYLSSRGIVRLRFQYEGVNIFNFNDGKSTFIETKGIFIVFEVLDLKKIPINTIYESGLENSKDFIYKLQHSDLIRRLQSEQDLFYLFVDPEKLDYHYHLTPQYSGGGGIIGYDFRLEKIHNAEFVGEKDEFKNHSRLFFNGSFDCENDDFGRITFQMQGVIVPNNLIDSFSPTGFAKWFKNEVNKSKAEAMENIKDKITKINSKLKSLKT